MTSNPALFEQAIVVSRDYEADIREMAALGKDAREIYESLSQHDVRSAADEFRPLYDRTDGRDGYVSLEVSPRLAYDTHGTIIEARRLWAALGRPNILINVPATIESLPAIQQLISEGINVNVTMLFELSRYQQVVDAYLAGLEKRIADGKPVWQVVSVASFFLSRMDTILDALLDQLIAQDGAAGKAATRVHGQVAISSAKLAYQIYKENFSGERFNKLTAQGARGQRLLWASTVTKNPDYSDIKYVEALIGPDTISAVSAETFNAFRDHGKPKPTLEQNVPEAVWVLQQLPELGIRIPQMAQRLEAEGVEKFNQLFDKLMGSLSDRLR